jgi:hypothetical protein
MATKLKVKTIEPATGTTLSLGNPDDAVTISSDSIKVNTWKDSGNNTLWTSDGSGAITSINSGLSGGGYALIKTLTASGDSSLSFVDGTDSVVLDSTYDEYMFVFTDLGPATDSVNFTFQMNAADASGFNETITSTAFWSYHKEDGSDASIGYDTGRDQAQGTAYQVLGGHMGNGSDESMAGILHVFSPSNTTYVTHWYSTTSHYNAANSIMQYWMAGYINAAAAMDEISFKMSSGNFDGVIQMYGIS